MVSRRRRILEMMVQAIGEIARVVEEPDGVEGMTMEEEAVEWDRIEGKEKEKQKEKEGVKRDGRTAVVCFG